MGWYVVLGQCCSVERALVLPSADVWNLAVTPRWDLGLNVTSAKMFARLERLSVVSQHVLGHVIKGVCNTLGNVH